MDQRSRLERLEKRLEVLEEELRDLRRVVGSPPDAGAGGGLETEVQPVSWTSDQTVPAPDPSLRERQRGAAPKEKGARSTRDRVDLEKWFGEHALLVVGLLALVGTAGFLLKYAFDQGWISPALRVIAGLVAGAVLFGFGERALRRGLGRYGAGLIGGGGAIAYLSVWAASGPYQFVPPGVGIGALAVLSGLVLFRAVAHAVQYVAAIAALGAFAAPIMLGDAGGSANFLVAYCGLVGLTAGTASVWRGWKVSFGLSMLGFFLVPASAALTRADTALLSAYLVLGGVGALVATRRRRWGGLKLAAFVLAWWILAVLASESEGWRAWILVLLLPGLVAPSFLDYVRVLGRTREQGEQARVPPFERLSISWWGYPLASAGAWAGATVLAAPSGFDDASLLFLGCMAVPYLWVSMLRRSPGVGAIGFGLLAWGVGLQVEGHAVTVGWLLLAVLSGMANRSSEMASGRWTGASLASLGLRHLTVGLADRPTAENAFFGPWSLVLYLVIATFAGLAGPLFGPYQQKESGDSLRWLRVSLWAAAGLLVVLGGTLEILLHFKGAPSSQELARDLTVSAFWLVYAGLLIGYGFWREAKGVRLAGLVVTAAAIVKTMFYDLTRLEALYRVGALGLLAAIALLATYAYHRRASEADSGR